jgi:hypothetical protein
MVGPFKSVDEHLKWLRAEGFVVGHGRCKVCGYVWVGGCEPGADPSRLECGECGEADSEFVVDDESRSADRNES